MGASIAFSLDERLLAVANSIHIVRVFDTKTMAKLRKVNGKSRVWNISFSPAGQLLAVVTSEKIHIYGVFDGRHIELEGPDHDAINNMFHPVDELFAYASHDNSVRFWQADTKRRPSSLVGHSSKVRAIVFSPDGRLLASVCSELLMVWDVSSGARLYSLSETIGRLRRPLFSPDGRLLAWQTQCRQIGYWRTDNGVSLGTVDSESAFESMAFSPDGRIFACLTNSGLIDVRDVDKLIARTSKNEREVVTFVTASPDSKLLAWSLRDGSVRVMAKEKKGFSLLLTMNFHEPTELMFSPNGARLSIESKDYSFRVVDIPGGDCTLTLRSELGLRGHPAFSTDSQLWASVIVARHIQVYNFCTGTLDTVPCDVDISIAFSQDSKVLAGASDRDVRFWSGCNWRVRRKMNASWAHHIAFSPNNRWFALAGKSVIKLYDITQQGALYAFIDVARLQSEISFSSDSLRLRTERGAVLLPGADTAVPESQAGAVMHFDIQYAETGSTIRLE